MSLPPAHPAYILRGHAAQVHSATFIRANTYLVTGDADGWILIWSLSSKRPVAVWRAHQGAILRTAAWGQERLITHGKDNKLIVWKLAVGDEAAMSTVLPVEDSISPRKQPWLLHVLEVNTLNFCSFAYCTAQEPCHEAQARHISTSEHSKELIIAVPNTLISNSVDIFHLPSETRSHTVSGDKSVNTGMVMAISIFYSGTNLTVIAGYESGHTLVTQQADTEGWHILYMSKPHSQPILSLAVDNSFSSYITSSADAIIAKHPIPTMLSTDTSTARKEPSFVADSVKSPANGSSLLSMALTSGSSTNRSPRPRKIEIQTTPLKVVQTKHSGQQSLKIRSDGKIFATAGWDSRVRVYSAQNLKELAVLKWHKEGCYAVDFADVGIHERVGEEKGETDATDEATKATSLIPTGVALAVKDKRDLKAITTHWLAAGSKDGKVSLWDIY